MAAGTGSSHCDGSGTPRPVVPVAPRATPVPVSQQETGVVEVRNGACSAGRCMHAFVGTTMAIGISLVIAGAVMLADGASDYFPLVIVGMLLGCCGIHFQVRFSDARSSGNVGGDNSVHTAPALEYKRVMVTRQQFYQQLGMNGYHFPLLLGDLATATSAGMIECTLDTLMQLTVGALQEYETTCVPDDALEAVCACASSFYVDRMRTGLWRMEARASYSQLLRLLYALRRKREREQRTESSTSDLSDGSGRRGEAASKPDLLLALQPILASSKFALAAAEPSELVAYPDTTDWNSHRGHGAFLPPEQDSQPGSPVDAAGDTSAGGIFVSVPAPAHSRFAATRSRGRPMEILPSEAVVSITASSQSESSGSGNNLRALAHGGGSSGGQAWQVVSPSRGPRGLAAVGDALSYEQRARAAPAMAGPSPQQAQQQRVGYSAAGGAGSASR